MRGRMSRSPFRIAVAAALIGLGTSAAAAQAQPDSENGRYTFSPAADGLIRLDTHTGAVSNCSNSGTGWACYAVPDERAALDAELGRLQAENERLKAQLAERSPEKSAEALPKSDQLKPGAPTTRDPKVAEGERKIEIPLPSDQDVDRMMSFVERAWRRLVDMANRVQRDVSGKI